LRENILSPPGGSSVHFSAGTVLFRPGDGCKGLLVVDSGAVRVQTVSETGRQVTLYRVEPDTACVLSTQCLLTHGTYPAEGVAETEVIGRFIGAAEFERRIAGDPGFRLWLFAAYGARLADLVLLVEDLLVSDLDGKLCRFLLERSASEPVVSATHQSIAAEIGSAREAVSRHLKDLERQGAVKLARGAVTVLDRRILQQRTR
jgi:CRP/FNR family transcriptional regulator